MNYESTKTVAASAVPNVRFRIRRASLGRRIELTRQIHELSKRLEFASAGSSPADQIEAAWLAHEIDQICLRWGVEAVDGLHIDGSPATVEQMIAAGPEALAREAVAAVRTEAFLSADERKNS